MIFLEEHPKDAEGILENVFLPLKLEMQLVLLVKQFYVKRCFEGLLTGKLSDCSSRDASILNSCGEGDSVGGSAKQGRDRNTRNSSFGVKY